MWHHFIPPIIDPVLFGGKYGHRGWTQHSSTEHTVDTNAATFLAIMHPVDGYANSCSLLKQTLTISNHKHPVLRANRHTGSST
jgi:hypothetical protein